MTKKSTHDHRADPDPAEVAAHAHEHDEELLHVPKGQSKTRFYLMVGLMLFVCVMFVVPGALFSTATGPGQADVVYASWHLADGKKREMSGSQFFEAKRSLRWIADLAAYFGLVGTNPGEPFDPGNDFDTARFLIMEQSATEAGIRVSDLDLGKAIDGLFQGADSYKNWLAGRRLSPAEFERVFRRLLLVQRFRTFLSAAASGVDPQEIEDIWKGNHQEYAFDYVEMSTADFADAALAEVPDDEALEAWFNALSPFQKATYDTQLAWSADLAYVPLTDGDEPVFDATLLLEKYPRPEDEDAAAKALDYYERVKFTRFLRDEPLEDVEGPESRVFPFDEVEAACVREAPTYYALEEWHRELNQRLADGSLVSDVDLGAEAAAVGLTFVTAGEPRSMTEWTEVEGVPYAGSRLPTILRSLQVGNLTPVVVVEKGALVVGEQAERVEPGTPPFADIREQVAEAWAKDRQSELALEALEAVRSALAERPADPVADPETGVTPEPQEFLPIVDLQTFADACQAASLEVMRRDFEERTFDTRAPVAEDEAPVAPVLRFTPTLYNQEDGAVPSPVEGRNGELVFLFRCAGSQDASLDKMKPLEYWRERQTLVSTAVSDFFARTYDSKDFLRERYGLYLLDSESESEPGS